MSYFLYAHEEESSAKVDIDELFENKKKKDLKQLSIFNKILNRVHNRIKITGRSRKEEKHIWFNIPEYIFGQPLYDKGECIAYIVHKLELNGFLVKYIHPNTIFVCWSNWVPQYVRSEFKKKTGKILNEKGEIYHPEKDIEKTEEENLVKNPSKKEQKHYEPIDKYKPTGKFVYNPNLLEKIEKKLY